MGKIFFNQLLIVRHVLPFLCRYKEDIIDENLRSVLSETDIFIIINHLNHKSSGVTLNLFKRTF